MRVCLLAILSVWLAIPAMAQVSVDTYSFQLNSSSATSHNMSMTVAANTDKVLWCIFAVESSNPTVVSSASWNTSESLTRDSGNANAGGLNIEGWYLVNPTATTANVTINYGDSRVSSMGCISLYDVDQTPTLRTAATDQGSDSSLDLTVTDSANNDFCIMGINGGLASDTITAYAPRNGETERSDVLGTQTGNRYWFANLAATGASTVLGADFTGGALPAPQASYTNCIAAASGGIAPLAKILMGAP